MHTSLVNIYLEPFPFSTGVFPALLVTLDYDYALALAFTLMALEVLG